MNDYGLARVLSRLFFVIVATLAVAILYLAKVLLLPLACAILFAFLLAPLVAGLERHRVPPTLAATAVILGFAAVLGSAGWVLFSQLVAITNDLPAYSENITEKLTAIRAPSDSPVHHAALVLENLSDELRISDPFTSVTAQPASSAGKKPLGSTPDRPIQVRDVARSPGRLDEIGGILGPVTTVFLSVVLTFCVLLQRKDLRNRMIGFSGDHNLRAMTEAFNDASGRISRYFSLQVLVNAVYGSIIFIALHFIGLPNALLFGTLAAICRFVPYIGWPVATAVPTVLSMAVFHGWTKSILIVLIFLVLEIVVFNFAEPRIYGRHIGLSSLAIMMAASFWTLIWGPVGLALSVPLTVCLVVMGRHIPSLEFLTSLLGDQPIVPLSSCFYQRLLAHDEHEAAEIMANSLKDSNLEDVYDRVLIPALIMSEEDRIHRDLEDSTVEFIRHTARELIDEFGLRENAEVGNASDGDEASPGSLEETRPDEKVMCIPISDETDELAALMMAQVLNREGTRSFVAPSRRLADMLTSVAMEKPDVVVLCGLPPFAMARSQRMYRILRTRNPRLKIMMGILNDPDEASQASEAIGEKDVPILTKLSQAVAEICKEPVESSAALSVVDQAAEAVAGTAA